MVDEEPVEQVQLIDGVPYLLFTIAHLSSSMRLYSP
jgi:hypothetical protein